MASQRVGVGGSPIEPRLSNGPLRAQSKKVTSSILRRGGIRQLPGICWYSEKSTGHPYHSGRFREARWHRG